MILATIAKTECPGMHIINKILAVFAGKTVHNLNLLINLNKIELCYLPFEPINRPVHGVTHCFVWGGITPINDVLCSIVDILLECTETKLPPIPLIIG